MEKLTKLFTIKCRFYKNEISFFPAIFYAKGIDNNRFKWSITFTFITFQIGIGKNR